MPGSASRTKVIPYSANPDAAVSPSSLSRRASRSMNIGARHEDSMRKGMVHLCTQWYTRRFEWLQRA